MRFGAMTFGSCIKVRLEAGDQVVNLLAEDDATELVEHGLVQPFDDSVGLRRFGLGSGMVDVFQGQIQLVFVMLGVAAVFRAAVRQHTYALRHGTRAT